MSLLSIARGSLRHLGRNIQNTKKCFVLILTRGHSQLSDVELKRAFTSTDGKPIIAGRPYLAGSSDPGMPQYLSPPRDDFPVVVDMVKQVTTDKISEELVTSVKATLMKNLPLSGAVLFRGLPLKTAGDVSIFVKYLGAETMPYVGGIATRESVSDQVWTASRDPPNVTIECHNEMSYLPTAATHLAFFCEVPPGVGCGGESVLTLNREFQSDLDPEVTEKFKRLGIRYSKYFPSTNESVYLSWQEVLKTDDKKVAERLMSEQGHSYKWHENGALSYWYTLPATRPHHTTGEEIWFNQVEAMNATYFRSLPYWDTLDIPDEEMPLHTYYGDGTPIEPEVLQHIRNVIWKHAVGMRMNQGELLFLDNMLVQHGRLGYVGDRRLLVTIISDLA